MAWTKEAILAELVSILVEGLKFNSELAKPENKETPILRFVEARELVHALYVVEERFSIHILSEDLIDGRFSTLDQIAEAVVSAHASAS